MKLKFCCGPIAAAVLILAMAQPCDAVQLKEYENEGLAQTSSTSSASAEGAMKEIFDMLFGGGSGGGPYNQHAPNINVVDNGRVMIPEGADPTAVKYIIGDIMN